MVAEPKFELKPISEIEEKDRQIMSRNAEKDILEKVHAIFEASIENKPINDDASRLEDWLQGCFNEWQLFSTGRNGMNAGQYGEMFARLVGYELMEDMPEICELPYNSSGYGVKILQIPGDEDETGIMEIITDVGDDELIKGCKFRFRTSMSAIDERLSQIKSEVTRIRNKKTVPEVDID